MEFKIPIFPKRLNIHVFHNLPKHTLIFYISLGRYGMDAFFYDVLESS